jgi:hypothetical protein
VGATSWQTKSGNYCQDAGDLVWIDLDPTVGLEQSGKYYQQRKSKEKKRRDAACHFGFNFCWTIALASSFCAALAEERPATKGCLDDTENLSEDCNG